MSYALRNTLILAVLLLLVLVGGGYWVWGHQRADLASVRQEATSVRGELQQLEGVDATLKDVTAKLEDARQRWANLPKVIPPQDDPASTYAYLNRIVSSGGCSVSYNYLFQEGGGNDTLRWNKYLISDGTGSYADLYGFLWRLENQRRLYRIKALTLEELRTTDERTGVPLSQARFGLELIAYYMPGVETPSRLGEEFLSFQTLKHNPFRPLVYEELPPNSEGLVEVDKAELMGITGSVIYVRDQTGELRNLSVGDRVYLGRLVHVDPIRGRARFALNKAGIGESVTLVLGEPSGK